MSPAIRFQRVKILATLGPASRAGEVVTALAQAGADGFRINTAHTPPEHFAQLVELVRAAERASQRPLAVVCDLAGPKLRVHASATERQVTPGDELLLGPPGSQAAIPVDGFEPAAELTEGSRVLLHDGTLRLTIVALRPPFAVAVAETAGRVAPRMGINLPDRETSLPSLTARDLAALEAGVAAGVDVFALSFVRRAADVDELRRHLAALGSHAPIIAKIEKAQAVETATLEEILAAAEMVMVARGDLGAETSPERVPVLQKYIVRRARQRGVPVMIATEMLESLVRASRPTRAEASDVANAVFDGADALLLTAETAIGAHPVLAVQTCARIVAGAEGHPGLGAGWGAEAGVLEVCDEPAAEAVARAAVVAAREVGAAAIVCFTTSGRTARLVARHRPPMPILALTPSTAVARALALLWGVEPRLAPAAPHEHESVVSLAEREAQAHGLLPPGGLLVVTHGAPLGSRPATNVLRIHRSGGVL